MVQYRPSYISPFDSIFSERLSSGKIAVVISDLRLIPIGQLRLGIILRSIEDDIGVDRNMYDLVQSYSIHHSASTKSLEVGYIMVSLFDWVFQVTEYLSHSQIPSTRNERPPPFRPAEKWKVLLLTHKRSSLKLLKNEMKMEWDSLFQSQIQCWRSLPGSILYWSWPPLFKHNITVDCRSSFLIQSVNRHLFYYCV